MLLPSAEYYLLGLGHPIMQTYYNLLVNVATLLGADRNRAKREMKELIEFEIELASVCIKFNIFQVLFIMELFSTKNCSVCKNC